MWKEILKKCIIATWHVNLYNLNNLYNALEKPVARVIDTIKEVSEN